FQALQFGQMNNAAIRQGTLTEVEMRETRQVGQRLKAVVVDSCARRIEVHQVGQAAQMPRSLARDRLGSPFERPEICQVGEVAHTLIRHIAVIQGQLEDVLQTDQMPEVVIGDGTEELQIEGFRNVAQQRQGSGKINLFVAARLNSKMACGRNHVAWMKAVTN